MVLIYQLVELPDDLVAESIPFRLLQTHVGYLSVDYESRRLELNKASEEADMLREMQESFREKVFVSLIYYSFSGRKVRTKGVNKMILWLLID